MQTNVTTPFKAKGYIRNKEGLFIKHDPQHHVRHPNDASHLYDKPLGQGLEAILSSDEPTPKRVGRPPRKGEKPKKLTIEISQDVYKALMHFKIDEGIYVNGFIEELIKKNIPSKYFEI
ncbi:MAG: hypothetical protein NHB14_27210 [Desulfosporosinus sp.]|nr:hypothetical protein [Desulfosporosinus sp.]